MLTTKQLDDDPSQFEACQGPDATAYHVVLKIVNTFRTVMCLTPKNNGNGHYDVALVTRLTSTRIMPFDPNVRKLEIYWKRTLPVMETAEMSDNGDVTLKNSNGDMKIVLKELADSS